MTGNSAEAQVALAKVPTSMGIYELRLTYTRAPPLPEPVAKSVVVYCGSATDSTGIRGRLASHSMHKKGDQGKKLHALFGKALAGWALEARWCVFKLEGASGGGELAGAGTGAGADRTGTASEADAESDSESDSESDPDEPRAGGGLGAALVVAAEATLLAQYSYCTNVKDNGGLRAAAIVAGGLGLERAKETYIAMAALWKGPAPGESLVVRPFPLSLPLSLIL